MVYKFKCDNCKRGNFDTTWHTIYQNGKVITLCQDCYTDSPTVGKKALTTWQKKKLGWYRDEHKWNKDIENRVPLPNGDIGITDDKGNIKEVRPKGYEGVT